MDFTRRKLMGGVAATAAMIGTGCATAPMGSQLSYLTQVLEPQNNNTVFHWLDIIMQQVRDQRVPPPRAAYNFAMPLAAGFLAANSIIQAYDEPFGIGTGPRGADPEVAYGVAFATAASEVFQTPFLAERKAFIDRFPAGQAKTLGIEWGRKVGLKVVKMRTHDGSEPSMVNYYLGRFERRQDALRWRPTGPFYGATLGPAFGSFDRGLYAGHGKITPWTMRSTSQFRVSGFYDPASPEFAQEFDMIRHLGAADSPIRTHEQSQIAMFWEDGPWGITPPGHYLYIATQILQYRRMSFIDLARTFALLGMTQCDASISAWDNKYFYDILRPESAIRVRAPKFGNRDPRVRLQPGWQSLIPTPEFPSYTSGHSTFGAAAAELLALTIGRDDVAFSGRSPDLVLWPQLKDVSRSWTSLSAAAEENGWSRLYGGVHWQIDHTMAMKAGQAIARQAHAHMFPRKA